MVKRCSAPGCASKYAQPKDPNLSLHYFPSKKKNVELYEKWMEALPWAKGDWTPCSTYMLCSQHFRPRDYVKKEEYLKSNTDVKTRKYAKLKPDAVPSLFYSVKGFVPSPEKEEPEEEKVVDFNRVFSYKDLREKFPLCENIPQDLHYSFKDTFALFYYLHPEMEEDPFIICSLRVDINLHFIASACGKRVPRVSAPFADTTSHRITCLSEIMDVMLFLRDIFESGPSLNNVVTFLKTESVKQGGRRLCPKKLSFLTSQLSILQGQGKKYSREFLSTLSGWKHCSIEAYNKICEDALFAIPSSDYLHKLSKIRNIPLPPGVVKKITRERILGGKNHSWSVEADVLGSDLIERLKSLVLFTSFDFSVPHENIDSKTSGNDDKLFELSFRVADMGSSLKNIWFEEKDAILISYIGGYVSQKMMEIVSCEHCLDLLINNSFKLGITLEEEHLQLKSKDQLMEFNQLLPPSDLLYQTLIQLVCFFDSLLMKEEALSLLKKCPSPHQAFQIAFCSRVSEVSSILDTSCVKEHPFLKHLNHIIKIVFHILYKNRKNSPRRGRKRSQPKGFWNPSPPKKMKIIE